jgi:hypothetical protein
VQERLTVINMPDKLPCPAYEYRASTLIPGQITRDGRFVPKIGGTIIDFKSNLYKLKKAYIWNLPGYITEQSKE